MWSHPQALAAAAIATMLGCATAPPGTAIIEAGDAWQIDQIDRKSVQPWVRAFQVKPGGHTVDVTITVPEPERGVVYSGGRPVGPGLFGLLPPKGRARRLLCVKAKDGRRYRIKIVRRGNETDAFIVDASTGDPPKTPCGPDEDDD